MIGGANTHDDRAHERMGAVTNDRSHRPLPSARERSPQEAGSTSEFDRAHDLSHDRAQGSPRRPRPAPPPLRGGRGRPRPHPRALTALLQLETIWADLPTATTPTEPGRRPGKAGSRTPGNLTALSLTREITDLLIETAAAVAEAKDLHPQITTADPPGIIDWLMAHTDTADDLGYGGPLLALANQATAVVEGHRTTRITVGRCPVPDCPGRLHGTIPEARRGEPHIRCDGPGQHTWGAYSWASLARTMRARSGSSCQDLTTDG